jgi:hypothetical protein
MRLHVLSDLHVDFAPFVPPVVDADVVVLAGDIGIGTNGLTWARKAFPDTRIVQIAGNHEFYGSQMEALSIDMRMAARDQGIIYLENNVAEFPEHGVRIIGSTLWTDFQLFGSSRTEIANAQKAAGILLRDFSVIRCGRSYLTPEQTVDLHAQARNFISAELAKPYDGKTVAVTHHCPAWASVHPKFQHDIVSAAFASRCEDLIEKAHLWVHGHTHCSVDTRVGDDPNRGRIICNPRGYPQGYLRGRPSPQATTFENREFNPGLVVEI